MKKSKVKPQVLVRQARSADRDAVFKFCRKTWSWGDYIPRVWDEWLKDRRGRVFVAILDGKPVGVSHLSMDSPREVWLSGARTDPSYRRMGIATAITKKCLKYAKAKGAKVARLTTGSNNKAAQALLKKMGFKPITEFVESKTEKMRKEESTNSRWARQDETDAIWNYLQTSKVFRRAAGLYTVLFHWFSLEKHELERFIQQQKAIIHFSKRDRIDGLTLIDDTVAKEWQEKTIQTCLIDGNFTATCEMIKFLKTYCHAAGIKKIYRFACNHKQTLSAFEELGFEEPDSIDIVYEKKL